MKENMQNMQDKQSKQNHERIAAYVLERVGKKMSGQAEIFIQNAREMSVEVADNKVEDMLVAEEIGLGLRIINEQRLGYAFSSDLSRNALDSVVEQAINNAAEAEADPAWELAAQNGEYPCLELYDGDIFLVSTEEKIELAKGIEAAARAYDARIKLTQKAAYQEAESSISIFNSAGLYGSFTASYCGGYAVVVGQEDGDSQTGFGLQYDLKYQAIDAAKIGREAAAKAVGMLGAKRITSAKMPVVLDPYTVTHFLAVLQTAFSADAVLKGRSFLEGYEQKQMASPLVTLVDNGAVPLKLGSRPFDAEGVPTKETILVQDGRLQSFLHNNYTAKRLGVSSTGNAVRGSFKGTPEVGITNFYLQAGASSKKQIIKEINRGLYITDVMGIHTANPISGDFSLGVSGFLIENGEMTQPVKGIAAAGNLKELLLDIDAVGNEVVFYVTKGSPVIRLKDLSISGA